MSKPHPSANLLIAVAQGKQMQVEGLTTLWRDATLDEALLAIHNAEPCRVKPDSVLVNGVECPQASDKIGSQEQWLVEIRIGRCYSGKRTKGTVFTFDSEEDAELVFSSLIKPFKAMEVSEKIIPVVDPPVPAYTTGHCQHKKEPGGCPVPNVHCGYPNCDRKPT